MAHAMKVLIEHGDGSKTVQYEPNDRVRFTRDVNGGGFLGAQKGELGTVIRGAKDDDKWPDLAFLDIQTDSKKEFGYGTISAAPWEVELEQVDP